MSTPEVLKTIPEDLREVKDVNLDKDEEISSKTLGVYLSQQEDNFFYKINVKLDEDVTKTTISSAIARTYDPLGWLSPVVVKAKTFLQQAWKANIDWKQKVPENLEKEFRKFYNLFHHLEEIKIPRWVNYTPEAKDVEYHGFSDASNKAIAAVVYLRIKIDGEIKISILAAKTKLVDPNKPNIPRYELDAAVLLARLMESVKTGYRLPVSKIIYWSDSSVVLHQLKKEAHKLKAYEAVRIDEIQETTKGNWFHVKGEENPADVGSRGIDPDELKNHLLWWSGPPFLKEEDIKYPAIPGLNQMDQDLINSRMKKEERKRREQIVCIS